MYSKFIGVTAATAALIEAYRMAADETEDGIIARELARPKFGPPPRTDSPELKLSDEGEVDLGQGVRVKAGERLILFLDKGAHDIRTAHGIAEAKLDGLYVDGEKVIPSKKSLIQPAMTYFQKKLGHRNGRGKLISLNAYQKWHVVRDGKLLPLERLKDPALARKRQRGAAKPSGDELLRQLGLLG